MASLTRARRTEFNILISFRRKSCVHDPFWVAAGPYHCVRSSHRVKENVDFRFDDSHRIGACSFRFATSMMRTILRGIMQKPQIFMQTSQVLLLKLLFRFDMSSMFAKVYAPCNRSFDRNFEIDIVVCVLCVCMCFWSIV